MCILLASSRLAFAAGGTLWRLDDLWHRSPMSIQGTALFVVRAAPLRSLLSPLVVEGF